MLLNKGKIEGFDNHKNLLGKSSLYKNLYEIQFRKQNDKENH